MVHDAAVVLPVAEIDMVQEMLDVNIVPLARNQRPLRSKPSYSIAGRQSKVL